MTGYSDKLSAFLDGELPDVEMQVIEDALAKDPTLQAELEALMAANAMAKEQFAEILREPVPLELAAAIQNAPTESPANTPRSPSRFKILTAVAAVIALAIGGAAGYFTGRTQGQQVASAPGWLTDIADYHGVYAAQSRHLVEVPASEADHIQTWLTKSVGVDVRIPDLSAEGLTFQGARLLVAVGKPVAQLMYTDADMSVVAICQIQSGTPRDGFEKLSINAFDMVTWGSQNSNFVVVGDENRGDLVEIAQLAASQT
ncbi:MAG: anti-sigma factor [Ruegeria sp.]|uniref:anti-sigma factor family protein n=1 Tax=Ruegeria sp. TaxID=1879320 RepID=UPI00349EC603